MSQLTASQLRPLLMGDCLRCQIPLCQRGRWGECDYQEPILVLVELPADFLERSS